MVGPHERWAARCAASPDGDGYNRPPDEVRACWKGLRLHKIDLKECDLRWIRSAGADLTCAELEGANLRFADLRGANLQGAKLYGADLRGAKVSSAKFRDADLSNARLDDVEGLSDDCLGGSILLGATLPDKAKNFKGLASIRDVSLQIQSLFKILLALCGFGVMAVLSVRDEQIIVHGAAPSVDLPTLNATISPIMFIYVMPIIICAIYVYLLVYILLLWKNLSMLPAIFPDGTALDRTAYPLTLNPFVRVHFLNLRDRAPNWFQMAIASMLVFLLAPATLYCFWSTCLRKHEAALSAIQATSLALSVGLSAFFLVFSRPILRDEWDHWSPIPSRADRVGWSILAWVAALAITLACCYFLPPGFALAAWGVMLLVLAFSPWLPGEFRRPAAIAMTWALAIPFAFSLIAYARHAPDRPNHVINYLTTPPDEATGLRALNIGWFRKKFGGQPFLDLSDKDLSSKPSNWSNDPVDEDRAIASVVGVDMGGVDMRRVVAIRTFLIKANLREARLNGAYFCGANLRGADLRGADLRGAFLPGVNLRNAHLQGANLMGVDFSGARWDEPLDDGGPNLQGARLDGARYEPAEIGRSRNIVLAHFGIDKAEDQVNDPGAADGHPGKIKARELLAKVGIENFRSDYDVRHKYLPGYRFDRMNLRGADFDHFSLKKASFRGADVRGANFRDADLRNTDFDGATIWGADVTGALLEGSTIKGECLTYVVCDTGTVRSMLSATPADQAKAAKPASPEKAGDPAPPVETTKPSPAGPRNPRP